MSKENILREAQKHEKDLVKFMRDLIAIPGESCKEEAVIRRIEAEMKKVGFDEIIIDKMGNIIGRIGNGKTKIMMDAHIDTVGVGDLSAWKHDPYKGDMKDGIIYGRGASDQRAGMVSMVYAGAIIKELGLTDDYTLYVTGTCQEEDCDGLPLLHMIRDEKVISPDYVVITEPTNLKVYRGHRGRMEMKVVSKGVSCHGSAPDRGENAVYKMMKVVEGIEKLNDKLRHDDFLGKGTITVSKIECKTPSLCAVPDECTIYIDRRLTAGENMDLAVSQIQKIIDSTKYKKDLKVEVLQYEEKSWTGLTVGQEKYYPTWVIPEGHVLTQALAKAVEEATGKAVIDKWTFSTNGVASMGRMGIPTIGFGPANEKFAHSVDDQVPVDHLVKAAAVYAMFPKLFTKMHEEAVARGENPRIVKNLIEDVPLEKPAKRGPGRPPKADKSVAKRKPGRPAKAEKTGKKKPGRPPKAEKAVAKRKPGRPPKAEKVVAKRKPGRPPKAEKAVAKRKPGRPPKNAAKPEEKLKRKPGRPPKAEKAVAKRKPGRPPKAAKPEETKRKPGRPPKAEKKAAAKKSRRRPGRPRKPGRKAKKVTKKTGRRPGRPPKYAPPDWGMKKRGRPPKYAKKPADKAPAPAPAPETKPEA